MWCHVPETDCPSAQAALDWIWASCSQNPDSTADAMSNGRNTRERCLSAHSAMDTSHQLQSGTTSQPLMDAHCADTLTPSLPDTPVNHSALPESDLAKMTNGTSGLTSPASSERSSQDGSSLKTSQIMSRQAAKPCCETYETWVSRLRQAYSLREKSAHRKNASDGSLWPAAMAGTPAQNGNSAAGNSDFTRRAEELAHELMMNWATPTLVMTRENWTLDQIEIRQAEVKAATKASGKQTGNGFGLSLAAQTTLWAASVRNNAKGKPGAGTTERGGRKKDLARDVENFMEFIYSRPDLTTTTDGLKPSQLRPISRRLFRSATSNVPATTLRRWLKRGTWRKRRLNVAFTEWLMGWPPGHALSTCSEMEWFHWQQRMRGALSVLPTAYAAWIWEPPTPPETQMEMFE